MIVKHGPSRTDWTDMIVLDTDSVIQWRSSGFAFYDKRKELYERFENLKRIE